jgi:hypothetical protein
MLDLSITSKKDFLTSLEQLTTQAAAISHDQMMTALESVPVNVFTAPELYKLVDFALDQIGQWQVKWLFSSAQAPDTIAQTEADAWERLWDLFAKSLVETVPEIKDQLRGIKDSSIAERLLQRKLEQDRGSRAAMLASSMMSRLANMLNRLGCQGIARTLYTRALYPSGTVGRARCGR